MKLLFSILVLSCVTNGIAMNKENRHHDQLIQASDESYCAYGQWGSSDGEPLDAIIPKEWYSSATPNPKGEQDNKLQEAIQLMQERKSKQHRQDQEKCCQDCINNIPRTAGFIGLSAILYCCFSYENKQQ